MNCLLCDEPITLTDRPGVPIGTIVDNEPTIRYMHRECALREVVGGIGHLIAHDHWCTLKRDPDAGLTYRQSALLTQAWIKIMGVDALR